MTGAFVPIPDAWLRSRDTFEVSCRLCVTPTTILNGYPMAHHPTDVSVSAHLRRDGFWESWVSVAIARAIQPGFHCMDVGAHVGYYSLLMVGRGAAAVLAAEPQLDHAILLSETIRANQLERVVSMLPSALSDRVGWADLYLRGTTTGGAQFATAAERPSDSTGYCVVPTTTLDVVAASMPRLDFIKIDCEGAEARIWEGMRETRERFPSLTIAMEVAPSRAYDLEVFLGQIEAAGYPLRMVTIEGEIVPCHWREIWDAGDWRMLWLSRA